MLVYWLAVPFLNIIPIHIQSHSISQKFEQIHEKDTRKQHTRERNKRKKKKKTQQRKSTHRRVMAKSQKNEKKTTANTHEIESSRDEIQKRNNNVTRTKFVFHFSEWNGMDNIFREERERE